MKISLLIHPEELTRKWIDRAAESGASVLALHPRGGAAATQTLSELLVLLAADGYRELIDYARSKGLTVEYEFHAMSYLLPRELFAEHPEYFRMDASGKRTPDLNLCPSCDAALDIVASRAVTLAHSLYGSSDNYYFWADDSKDSACHCPRCRALTPSDQALIITNRIARKIRAEKKDARVAYLAYFDTMSPPSSIAPENGVFYEFAPIERDFTKPLTEAGEEYAEGLYALARFFGKGNGRILEYWFDNSLFSRWKKPPKRFSPDTEIIRRDIAYYQALGYDDIASFACFLGEDYEKLYGEPDLNALKDIKSL